MDKRTQEHIYNCICFLKNHGYEVIERGDSKMDKWIAFTQDGMNCVLHGRVINDYVGTYCVKCKNSYERFVGLNQVIGFYDTKEECYSVR